MKYLKYFENINIKQQPFYLSNDYLYLSEEISKKVTPTLEELKIYYKNNPIWADRIFQEQDNFYNDVRRESGSLKNTDINLQKSVSYNNKMYKMNLSLHRRSPSLDNEFGTFKTYLNGNSGDSNMHGKNMKKATRECNLKFIIKLYPIVAHIKDFYKILKSKKPFLDIIKEAIDKDITLSQYGIPNEIKYLFDERIENAVKMGIKYNI